MGAWASQVDQGVFPRDEVFTFLAKAIDPFFAGVRTRGLGFGLELEVFGRR